MKTRPELSAQATLKQSHSLASIPLPKFPHANPLFDSDSAVIQRGV